MDGETVEVSPVLRISDSPVHKYRVGKRMVLRDENRVSGAGGVREDYFV